MLMDGLEIQEILLSELERTNRIDAEFYQKGNLAVLDTLNKWNKKAFSESFIVSDGNHMSISDYFCDEGIPYYRGQDIYNLFIENSKPICITKEAYDKSTMRRSYLKKNDVLMSIVGAIIGNSAIVASDREATCSCKLAIMRPNDGGILSEVMLVFIKTKYGQNQIQKFRRGAAQTGFLLEDFEQIYIPEFSIKFQELIQKLIQEAGQKTENARQLYEEAENMLIKELGYDGYNESQEINVEKNFSATFGKSGRLDAEYYQVKYDDYERILKAHGKWTTVGKEFLHVVTKSRFNEQSYNYTEIGDIDIGLSKARYSEIETSELPANAKIMVEKGDLLVSKVRPNRGAVAFVDEDIDNHIVSGAFTVLREKENYRKEVLMILLRTSIYKSWLLKFNVGTSYPTIKDEDILDMMIPVVGSEVEKEVVKRVETNKKYLDESEKLIKKAIVLMETAIEQGEEKALTMYK